MGNRWFRHNSDIGVKDFKIKSCLCYTPRNGPAETPVFAVFSGLNRNYIRREGEISAVEVSVRDNDVDQALRALKKKMQREGIFREMKMRRSYEKPSERRAREKAEAVRRARKLERKRLEREGF